MGSRVWLSMTRLSLGPSALVVAVLMVSACGGSESAPTPSVASTPATKTTAANLNEIVNLRGPAEITYRWSGAVRGGGPGRVISRLNGKLERWDTVTQDSDHPTDGTFSVYGAANAENQQFGCSWFIATNDRSKLHADCTDNAASTVMDGFLHLALFQNRPGHALPQRTILGHTASCYEFPALKEVCADAQGYVLYLSHDSKSGSDTFEATSFFPILQAFEWPPDTDIERTPTRLTGDPQSALSLDMPTQFHLSSSP
jgi:hypothetical protein